jgi:hypothetical protein
MSRKQVEKKTRDYLARCGSYKELSGSDYSFGFLYESTAMMIGFAPLNDQNDEYTLVNFGSCIVSDVILTPGLYEYCARQSLKFGSLYVHEDGSVILGHSLIGEFMGEDEFKVVLGYLIQYANFLDDVIVQRFGGKRHSDN